MLLGVTYLLLLTACVLAWKFLPKLDPNRFFVFFWTVQFIIGTLFFINSYHFSGYFFLYVAIIAILLFVSSLLAKKTTEKISKKNIEYQLNNRRAIIILCVSLIPAMVYPCVMLNQNGIHFSNILSETGLMDVNFRMAELRYSGTLIVPKWAQFMLAFLYFAPLFSGFIFKQLSKKNRWLCFTPAIPIIFILLTMNTKAVAIASVLLWISGCIGYSIFAGSSLFRNIGWKKITIIVSSFVAFIVLMAFSMMLRIGDIDKEIVKVVKRKFEIYTLGHLPTTDKWFYDDRDSISMKVNNYGKTIFQGITAPLHLIERNRVYRKHITYGHYLTRLSDEIDKQYRVPEGVETPEGIDSVVLIEIGGIYYHKHPLHSNVYTVFRPAIEDFGLIGSIFFFCLVGFIGSISYYLLKKRRITHLSLSILVSIFFFYIYYITSIFSYTSFIAAFILFFVFMKLSFNIKKDQYDLSKN